MQWRQERLCARSLPGRESTRAEAHLGQALGGVHIGHSLASFQLASAASTGAGRQEGGTLCPTSSSLSSRSITSPIMRSSRAHAVCLQLVMLLAGLNMGLPAVAVAQGETQLGCCYRTDAWHPFVEVHAIASAALYLVKIIASPCRPVINSRLHALRLASLRLHFRSNSALPTVYIHSGRRNAVERRSSTHAIECSSKSSQRRMMCPLSGLRRRLSRGTFAVRLFLCCMCKRPHSSGDCAAHEAVAVHPQGVGLALVTSRTTTDAHCACS